MGTHPIAYSTTPASNTPIDGQVVGDSMMPNAVDDVLRSLAASMREGYPAPSVKSADYTATQADCDTSFIFTSAATLTLPAPSTAGAGWRIDVVARAAVTLSSPSGTRTFYPSAVTTDVIAVDQIATIVCDGTNYTIITALTDLTVTASDVAAVANTSDPIVNGSFQVWQRGAARPDLFKYDYQNSTGGLVQQTVTPGTLFGNAAPEFHARVSSAAAPAYTSSDYVSVVHRIEDVRTFSGQTVSFLFWAKQVSLSGANIAFEIVQNFGALGSASVTGIGAQKFTLSGSWQAFSASGVSIPSVTGKTIGTGSYLEIRIWISAGAIGGSSDYDARTDSLIGQNITVDLYGLHSRAGTHTASAAANYVAPRKGDEIRRCQRFFYRDEKPSWVGVASTTTTVVAFGKPHPVQMASSPTLTLGGTVRVFDGTTQTISSLGSNRSTIDYAECDLTTSSGLTFGRPVRGFQQSITSGYIDVSCEL